jgi:hypothetical protein
MFNFMLFTNPDALRNMLHFDWHHLEPTEQNPRLSPFSLEETALRTILLPFTEKCLFEFEDWKARFDSHRIQHTKTKKPCLQIVTSAISTIIFTQLNQDSADEEDHSPHTGTDHHCICLFSSDFRDCYNPDLFIMTS